MDAKSITPEQWARIRREHPRAWADLESYSSENEWNRIEDLAKKRGMNLFKIMEDCHA